MKIPLAILAIVALLLLLLQWLAPPPDPSTVAPRTDLPWQVETHADGGSRVFDLELGRATLGDALTKFGPAEAMALFEPANGPLSLEAYFGNVQLGPLQAKVIVALDADDAELATLREHSSKREGSPSGDWKYQLTTSPEAQARRRIRAISYIPGTRNLDLDFFRDRFGEPAATRDEGETAVSWFYPRLGLSILIDDEAREVLEYQAPRDFRLPEDAVANPDAH